MVNGITHTEDLKNFLEKTHPYKGVKITPHMAQAIESCLPKLELFCITCSKERTFEDSRSFNKVDEVKDFLFNSSKNTLGEAVAKGVEVCYEVEEYNVACHWEDSDFVIDDAEILVQYICTHCQKKYYYLLEFSYYEIKKLCQYPSFFRINTNSIEKYKSLSKKYHKELKQSILSASNGLWVASFVYLRRILEDLVESRYKILEPRSTGAKFTDKYKRVDQEENITPEGLKTIQNSIYSVLSKGIHEYTEEECQEMHPPVSCVIELILDKQLAEKEYNKKITACKTAIQGKIRQN